MGADGRLRLCCNLCILQSRAATECENWPFCVLVIEKLYHAKKEVKICFVQIAAFCVFLNSAPWSSNFVQSGDFKEGIRKKSAFSAYVY